MKGENKLLLKIAGKPILQWSVENVLNSQVAETFVVVGEDFGKMKEHLKQFDVCVVHSQDYKSGMSASLKAGINALSPDTEGALVLLADQPNLKPHTINRFLESFENSGKKIVVGRYQQITGNPVLFHRDFFPELLRLQGDVGARSLLRRLPDEIATVEIPLDQCLDIDTMEDFKKMKILL